MWSTPCPRWEFGKMMPSKVEGRHRETLQINCSINRRLAILRLFFLSATACSAQHGDILAKVQQDNTYNTSIRAKSHNTKQMMRNNSDGETRRPSPPGRPECPKLVVWVRVLLLGVDERHAVPFRSVREDTSE